METNKKWANNNPQRVVIRKSENIKKFNLRKKTVKTQTIEDLTDETIYEPLYVPLKIRDYSKKS